MKSEVEIDASQISLNQVFGPVYEYIVVLASAS